MLRAELPTQNFNAFDEENQHEMSQELGNFIRKSVEARSLNVVFYLPKIGITYQLQQLIKTWSIPTRLEVKPVKHISEGQKAWSAVLTKYHGIKPTDSAQETKDSEIQPLYIDCRAIQHTGLFVLKLLRAFNLKLPQSHEEAVQLVRWHLSKTQLPFNCLLLDHLTSSLVVYLHTHLLSELLEPTPSSSSIHPLDKLQIGIVCIHSVCIDVQDILSSDRGDGMCMDIQAIIHRHDGVYGKVHSLVKQHIHSLLDSCGAQYTLEQQGVESECLRFDTQQVRYEYV
ncbi:hypothetical protein EON64_06770 [archaeon]|nr:MAG: hypothetical protein EON64_06770 [archaeon]